MADALLERPEIEDPPPSSRSGVWAHFSFPVNYQGDDGKSVVDKTTTVCRMCYTRIHYDKGNTSNMKTHLCRHHVHVPIDETRCKQPARDTQQPIPKAFRQQLPTGSK